MVAAHYLRKLAVSLLLALLALGAMVKFGAAASWSFVFMGDQRDKGSYGINQPIVTAMANQCASINPAFVLCGGDEIHGIDRAGQASLEDQYTHWKAAMAPILSISYPVRGNHETYGDNNTPGPDYAKHWMDNIANVLPQIPKNGPPNEVGMSYSFSHNNAFIIGLEESYATSWYQVNQTWLNQQLAANTLPWTFVYGHYTAFGFSRNLEPGSLADNPTQRDAFWKSLGDSSINIYFCGHVHVYNRARVSIDGGPEIQQIVVGTGGADLDSWDGKYDDPRVIPESHDEGRYGYTQVTVNGNTITVVYYVYHPDTNTWSAFDTYIYTMTSRNFGANNANQSIDPAILTNYYQGIGWGIEISKIGNGTLTLNSGASPYSYRITVSGGTLNVQGDYSQAPVTVQSGAAATLGEAGKVADVTVDAGGTLSGTGTVVGALANSGTVNPGNSPGTLSVVGTYVQTTTGTYAAEIASATSYDRINVTGAPGSASLDGALAPVLLGGYRPRGNQVFPGIITTTGGVTGNFSRIANQQISPTLVWQARYNPTSVDLWVQRNYTNAGLSLNSNQQGVGTMLNSVAGATTGDLDTVLNAIDYLPDSASVRNAYKQISPEKAGALSNLGLVAATFQMRNLATRTTNLRFGLGESGGSGLSGGGLNFSYSKLDGLMLAYNGASLANLFSARKEFQAPESRWGLYLDGGAAFGRQKSTLNQTGYNFTLGGFTAGGDYRLRDNLLVGLATGYSHTSSGFYGSGGSVNTNTIPFNAYAAYFPGSLYAYGSLGYALNLYDLGRSLSFNGIGRTASSSTTGNQLNLYGETGYDLKLSRFILTPTATLAYSALWVGGFTEQGAGALNLKVGSQSANSVQTGLGGRVTVPLKVGSVKVVPQGYVLYQHEFANGSRGLNASLSQGSSTFNFQTEAAKRNFALVGASVTAGLSKNLYAQVNYNAEVGRGNATAQFINVGLRYEF
jgi:outer membrane autotransporter protein